MSRAEKIENEDGSISWLSSDGKEYKTKSGAWKRSKKLEEKSLIDEKSEASVKVENEPEIEWSTMEFTESDITEVIPAPLKKIKARTGKPTKQQLENERGMNEAILTTCYRTGDVMLTRYKRAVLKDEDAPAIKHSDDDYKWIASVTQDALDHNGVNFASAIGPTQIALISNGVWFGKPLISIQAESGNKFLSGGRMVQTLRS